MIIIVALIAWVLIIEGSYLWGAAVWGESR